MKTEIGKIKVVEKWVESFDPQSNGKELSTWWEVFNGERWIGKAWSFKRAQRISREVKNGAFR